MSDLTAYLDSAPVERLLNELSALTRKPIQTILRQRSGLLGRVLAERTVPFEPMGDIKGQKQRSQQVIAQDISRVYAKPSKGYDLIEDKAGAKMARAFAKACKQGQLQEAADLLRRAGIPGMEVIAFDDGARHRRARRGRAGVPRSHQPVIVASRIDVPRYEREIQSRIFWAKAGWVTAARKIPGAQGLGKIPASVRKHPAPGTGIDRTGDERNPHIVLVNQVPYISSLMSPRTLSGAQKAFEDILEKDVQHQLSRLKRKHTRLLAA